MTDTTLAEFIDSVCDESHLRVEQDFGGGFVRLRSTEAEKRQAAQDIRSTEDIVIELLRNSRDAGAHHIFVATSRDDNTRTLVIIDDGAGVPEAMRARIFEPRVTSKLDTAHMDKWGMHGRGMALYSVSVNAQLAYVKCSEENAGSSFVIQTDLTRLGEKTDQSTFPRFEVKDGVHSMRGPRNILRTVAEFALEHRQECHVYCGSLTEIAATLYEYGMATTSPATRAFASNAQGISLPKRLALAADPADLASRSADLGLEISERSARRIIDGAIEGLPSLVERMKKESFPSKSTAERSAKAGTATKDKRGLKIDSSDLDELSESVSCAYRELAQRYFLDAGVTPDIKVTSEAIRITIPVEKLL